MHKYKINTYLKIIFSISLISVVSAFFIEYVLGHQPCNLCLIQRIPYGLTLIIIISNYFMNEKEQFIILLMILIFSFSFIMSFYHFGIEQGFINESAVCGLKDVSDIISKEELLEQLQLKTVSCKDVTFRVFGFSLTTINMIISLILTISLINIFKNYEKFKNKIEEFIRVDRGERGAVKIYEGQLLALNTLVKDENLKNIIEEMKVHEKEHCDFFEKEIKKRNITPTKFLPYGIY